MRSRASSNETRACNRCSIQDCPGIPAISFLAESDEEALAIVARTKLFKLAESLGGVESLIELPARMTHASTAEAPFAAPLNLIRLSVGLESPEDLLEDLELALTPVGTRTARSV